MIQFNLLPDVKIEYIRTERLKRVVVLWAVIATVIMVGFVVMLFLIVNVFERKHMNDLTTDIKTASETLEATPDLNKILTVQNQLSNLTSLHQGKAAVSRAKDYLSQVTPTKVSYDKIDIDIAEHKISFTGTADTLLTVNKFTDTLKFTKFKVGDEEKNAFSDVVLTNFGRDVKGSSFQIDLLFEPQLFDNTVAVTISVPDITSTRSVTEKPSADLFQPLSNPTGGGR